MPGLGGAWSWGWVGAWSRGGGVGIPACTEADPPVGETATVADSTHPTGMHSCNIFYSLESYFLSSPYVVTFAIYIYNVSSTT